MKAKILVSGSRDYNNQNSVSRVLDTIIKELCKSGLSIDTIEVVHGAARGADSCSGEWGYLHGYVVTSFPANWDMYGKGAGHIRNQQMADYLLEDCDVRVCVAFWDGQSRGTKNMIEHSVRNDILTAVVHIPSEDYDWVN